MLGVTIQNCDCACFVEIFPILKGLYDYNSPEEYT